MKTAKQLIEGALFLAEKASANLEDTRTLHRLRDLTERDDWAGFTALASGQEAPSQTPGKALEWLIQGAEYARKQEPAVVFVEVEPMGVIVRAMRLGMRYQRAIPWDDLTNTSQNPIRFAVDHCVAALKDALDREALKDALDRENAARASR
jgi:hypothetical protein